MGRRLSRSTVLLVKVHRTLSQANRRYSRIPCHQRVVRENQVWMVKPRCRRPRSRCTPAAESVKSREQKDLVSTHCSRVSTGRLDQRGPHGHRRAPIPSQGQRTARRSNLRDARGGAATIQDETRSLRRRRCRTHLPHPSDAGEKVVAVNARNQHRREAWTRRVTDQSAGAARRRLLRTRPGAALSALPPTTVRPAKQCKRGTGRAGSTVTTCGSWRSGRPPEAHGGLHHQEEHPRSSLSCGVGANLSRAFFSSLSCFYLRCRRVAPTSRAARPSRLSRRVGGEQRERGTSPVG
jgi:hypothetical protein